MNTTYHRPKQRPFIKFIVWVIIIMLVVAVFSPFIGYIFTAATTGTPSQ